MSYTPTEIAFISAYVLRAAADYALAGDSLDLSADPEPPEPLSAEEEVQLNELYDQQRAAYRTAEEAVCQEWQEHGVNWKTDGAVTPEGWAWRQAMAIGAIDDDGFTVVSVTRARELLADLKRRA